MIEGTCALIIHSEKINTFGKRLAGNGWPFLYVRVCENFALQPILRLSNNERG
jgi:hypothetical protein